MDNNILLANLDNLNDIVSIRYYYVEGSNTSPVGFIEGIYVKEGYRLKGVAKSLVRQGEKWAKTKGCNQIGSEVELYNVDSYNFHKSIGYTEMNRIIKKKNVALALAKSSILLFCKIK